MKINRPTPDPQAHSLIGYVYFACGEQERHDLRQLLILYGLHGFFTNRYARPDFPKEEVPERVVWLFNNVLHPNPDAFRKDEKLSEWDILDMTDEAFAYHWPHGRGRTAAVPILEPQTEYAQ